jgi:hypothetical protein
MTNRKMDEFKGKLIKTITKNLKKLDLSLNDDDVLLEDTKLVVEDTMRLINGLFKPHTELTETQFSDVYKEIGFRQDNEIVRQKFGDEICEEFFNNYAKYINKYKHLMGKILTEVQKKFSEEQ